MLCWFRERAPLLASTLLVTLSTLGAASIQPHGDDCHDLCVFVAPAHDESDHRFEAARQDDGAHPLHCLVCHWARAFRPYVEIGAAAVVTQAAVGTVFCDAPASLRPAYAAQPPLRSPPALS